MPRLFVYSSLVSFLLYACGGGSHNDKPKTPEELKMELAMKEKDEPLTYLSIKASMRKDEVKTGEFFHSAEYSPYGNTIYATITNTATIAKFTDIMLSVTFYSQTDKSIGYQYIKMREVYLPNSVNNFELKVDAPVEMKKFSIEIKMAHDVD